MNTHYLIDGGRLPKKEEPKPKTRVTQPARPTSTQPRVTNTSVKTSAPKQVVQTTQKATTTSAKPTSTASQRSSTILDQTQRDLDKAIADYRNFLKSASEGYYENQVGFLDASKAEALANLKKAYDEAVAQGKMSEEEAERQFEENVKAINEENYLNAQRTNLAATQRGIGSSQQYVAMQQGQQRFTANLRDENRTMRDRRINEIRDRIAQITNAYNTDVNRVEEQYQAGLRQARGQADMMFAQGMGQLSMQQVQNALQMKSNLTLMEQEQLNMIERMQKQHSLDLEKMKVGHQYDLEKIDVTFQNDLKKMAKQFGYEQALNSQRHQQALAQIDAQRRSAIAQLNAKMALERKELEDAYLNKESPAYKIRIAQLEESYQQAIKQYHTEALYQSLNQIMRPGMPGYSEWLTDPASVMSRPYSYLASNTREELDALPKTQVNVGGSRSLSDYLRAGLRFTGDWSLR